jgi:hypothetical protein
MVTGQWKRPPSPCARDQRKLSWLSIVAAQLVNKQIKRKMLIRKEVTGIEWVKVRDLAAKEVAHVLPTRTAQRAPTTEPSINLSKQLLLALLYKYQARLPPAPLITHSIPSVVCCPTLLSPPLLSVHFLAACPGCSDVLRAAECCHTKRTETVFQSNCC